MLVSKNVSSDFRSQATIWKSIYRLSHHLFIKAKERERERERVRKRGLQLENVEVRTLNADRDAGAPVHQPLGPPRANNSTLKFNTFQNPTRASRISSPKKKTIGYRDPVLSYLKKKLICGWPRTAESKVWVDVDSFYFIRKWKNSIEINSWIYSLYPDVEFVELLKPFYVTHKILWMCANFSLFFNFSDKKSSRSESKRDFKFFRRSFVSAPVNFDEPHAFQFPVRCGRNIGTRGVSISLWWLVNSCATW